MADSLTLRHRRQLLALSFSTVAALRVIWREFNGDPATFPRFAMPAAALIAQRHRMAADLGIEYFRGLRRKMLGASPSHPTVPTPVPHAAILASLEACGLAGTYIAIGNGMTTTQARAHAFARVARATQRHVANGARVGVAEAAEADGQSYGYRRVTAGTCDFCEELAAEGMHPSAAFPAHDGCQCVAEPQFKMTPQQLTSFASKAIRTGKFTEREVETIVNYTESDAELFNAALRFGEGGYAQGMQLTADFIAKLEPDIARLDEAVAKGVLTQDLHVFRGLEIDSLDEFVPGAVIEDAGFASTSLNPEIADEFAGGDGVVLEIDVPAGTHALNVVHGELTSKWLEEVQNEVVLPRGTKFMVKAVNGNHVLLEVMP